MFLQRLERLVQVYEANIQDEHARIKDAKTVSQALTEKASEMQAVTPYRTIQGGEPPTRPVPATFSPGTEPQRSTCPHSRECERWPPWCNRAVYPFLYPVSRWLEYGAGKEQGLFPYV